MTCNECIHKKVCYKRGYQHFCEEFRTADAEWEKAEPDGSASYSSAYRQCSACKTPVCYWHEMRFCPYCGAKIKGNA